MTRSYKLSASFICGNAMTFAEEIRLLEKGGIDSIHFDVMDGDFVPRYGLYPELLRDIRSVTSLPIDVHMMTRSPEKYVTEFAKAGATYVVVHAEATNHLHRAVSLIKNEGVKPGVALNLATPLSVLDYILDDIDVVMLMAINPGIVGHKLVPFSVQKIMDLRKKLDALGKSDIEIEIDGGVTPESGPLMIAAGATVLVCGTSVIYKKEKPLDEKIREFRGNIDRSVSVIQKMRAV